jgi:hypothetical protein
MSGTPFAKLFRTPEIENFDLESLIALRDMISVEIDFKRREKSFQHSITQSSCFSKITSDLITQKWPEAMVFPYSLEETTNQLLLEFMHYPSMIKVSKKPEVELLVQLFDIKSVTSGVMLKVNVDEQTIEVSYLRPDTSDSWVYVTSTSKIQFPEGVFHIQSPDASIGARA